MTQGYRMKDEQGRPVDTDEYLERAAQVERIAAQMRGGVVYHHPYYADDEVIDLDAPVSTEGCLIDDGELIDPALSARRPTDPLRLRSAPMTTTASRPKAITRTYRHPDGAVQSLTYRLTPGGRHRVVHEYPGDGPDRYEFDRVEDARRQWAALAARLLLAGFRRAGG